jgi:hypothetical protein
MRIFDSAANDMIGGTGFSAHPADGQVRATALEIKKAVRRRMASPPGVQFICRPFDAGDDTRKPECYPRGANGTGLPTFRA